MIELTEDQLQAMASREATPPRLVNPRTNEPFVLLRAEEYDRLKEVAYDDSPWSRQELEALAWERGNRAGWNGMDEDDEHDDAPAGNS